MPDAPPVASITTARLSLEPQVAADADPMFELLQDPAIYRYENEPPPSLEWLRERYRRLESRRSADGRERWLNWIVRLRTGEAAGFVQATVHDDNSAGLAYVFASRYWGQGLAGEAVRAMIGELVTRYSVARLAAVLKRSNAPSVRLLERLGFVRASPEAHLRQAIPDDEILMERDAPRTGADGVR
jgi:RimJ/RimL family protein N-acetyltransferase